MTILRSRLGENFSWSGLGIWIGLVNGSDQAEVEIDYGYHTAADLRSLAQALNEAADIISHSPSLDRELIEAIQYLEIHQQHIGLHLKDITVNVPASQIGASIIAMAKALREKDGQS